MQHTLLPCLQPLDSTKEAFALENSSEVKIRTSELGNGNGGARMRQNPLKNLQVWCRGAGMEVTLYESSNKERPLGARRADLGRVRVQWELGIGGHGNWAGVRDVGLFRGAHGGGLGEVLAVEVQSELQELEESCDKRKGRRRTRRRRPGGVREKLLCRP
jgi:hypothetical protein